VTKPKAKGLRIFLWFAFSVVCALFPLAVSYINGRANGKPPGWLQLLAGGELFLISAVVAADAVGRVFLGGDRKQGFRIVCGVGCALLLLVTSAYFARIAFSVEERNTALANAIESKNIQLAFERLHEQGVDGATSSRDSLILC
jgi:hypothetical protein